MAQPEKTDADVAMPRSYKVAVGSGEDRKEYHVQTFKMGKTLIALKHLSVLLAEDAVQELISGGDFKKVLTKHLARLLDTAQDTLYELFAIILTPNKEIIRLKEEGGFEEHLKAFRRRLLDDVETEDAFAIVQAGIDAMGVDVLVKNLSSLTNQIQKTTTKPATTTTLTVVPESEA